MKTGKNVKGLRYTLSYLYPDPDAIWSEEENKDWNSHLDPEGKSSELSVLIKVQTEYPSGAEENH